MVKPFDVSKFRKSVTKSIEGISLGFNDPKTWLNTGSYVLNYLISRDFFKGIPLEGKFTMIAGESGSGKSYVASGNVIKDAQEQGIFVVLFDSENALDTAWLHQLGVDTSEDKLLKVNASMIDDVTKFIMDFVKDYKISYADAAREDKPKILFVVDSLGMLLTPTDKAQAEAGDMKGDMGRKAKQLTAMCRNLVAVIASENIGLVATNHVYASGDQYNPDDIIAGGKMIEFASSIIVSMNKRKLKEDEEGNKLKVVQGIRSAVQVRKSRYNQPFQKIEVRIPYTTGMDPFSGLFDFFLNKGVLVKEGNRYKYESPNGKSNSFAEFRKNITNEQYMTIMQEWKEPDTAVEDLAEGDEEE